MAVLPCKAKAHLHSGWLAIKAHRAHPSWLILCLCLSVSLVINIFGTLEQIYKQRISPKDVEDKIQKEESHLATFDIHHMS
jgi:hypothetical protein